MCKVIGVMSFKGGVGKSVSVINLGAGLVKLGKRVLIVDGNFLSPNLHFYLGLIRPGRTLKEIIRDGLAPENAIYEHKSGLHLMPCNFYKNIDLKKFKRVIEELKMQYDYIIVDSGPSYTDEIVAIFMICDELIFITTPDYPTLAATVRVAKIAKYKDINIRGIIVNRRKNRRLELTNKDIENTVGLKIIAEIPEDVKITKSVLKFMPVVGMRWSRSGKAYLKLSKEILKSD